MFQKKAQEFKNTGNKSFKLGNYTDAIDNYTKAIEICPRENSTDLSTFYQNRAAAYEQLVILYTLMMTIDCYSYLQIDDDPSFGSFTPAAQHVNSISVPVVNLQLV